MKIVITGTSGRIGRAIHFNLCRDHAVVGIDRTVASATSHIGDITDFGFMVSLLDSADAVIHTAAHHAPHVGLVEDEAFVRTNILGTQVLVRAMREQGVGTLVFTSTTALYGYASQQPDSAAWLNESSQPQPRTIYHRTKLEAESFLESEASEEFRITTLRMSRCFPEPAPLMAAYRLHRGVDARDVAEGHRLALTPGDEPYRTFILSGATPFQLSDAELLKTSASEVLRQRSPGLCALFEERDWPLPTSIDRVYDSSLAQKVLGWAPKFGFEDVPRLLDAGISEVLPPEAAGTSISE